MVQTNKKINFGKFKHVQEIREQKLLQKKIIIKDKKLTNFKEIEIDAPLFEEYCKTIERRSSFTEKSREMIMFIFFTKAINSIDKSIKIQNPDLDLKIGYNKRLEGTKFTGYLDCAVTDEGSDDNDNYLLVCEAKKDDFEHGEAQLLLEMYTVFEKQKRPIYGVVSNLKLWDFYEYSEDNNNILITKYSSLLFHYEERPLKREQIMQIVSTAVTCIEKGINLIYK